MVELERMPCDARAFTAWMRTRDAIKKAIKVHESLADLADYFLQRAAERAKQNSLSTSGPTNENQ